MKKSKPKEKMFIVRKYIPAKSAAEAIRKDRITPVHDVWIDDEWKKGESRELASAIGFCVNQRSVDDWD